MRYESRNLARPAFFFGLLLLLVVVVAACSPSDSESSETVPTTVAAEATTTTDEHDHDHDHDEDHDHEDDASENPEAGVVELDQARRLLVVAAHDQAVIHFIDLADGSAESIELDAIAAVSSSITESGRFLLAGHDDGVTVVDTGVWSEGHGTHLHHYTSEPMVLGRVNGPNPTHLISHDHVNALYFDGTGTAKVISEESLEEGEVTVMAEVPTSQPHHGFAMPVHGAYFVTVPTEDMEGLPNVVGISDAEGTVEAQFDCPLTHGEASLVDGAASACSDGVVLVTEDAGTWTGTYLTYPEIDDEDPFGFGPARAWFLRVSSDKTMLAAPQGSRHLLVVDAENAEIRSIDFERSIATFGVVFDSEGHLIVLTLDGFIHLVEPGDGSVIASLEIVSPFEEGDTEQPWRQVAVTGDHVYVTDPATDQVVEVAVGDTLTLERVIDLDFAPGFLAIANG